MTIPSLAQIHGCLLGGAIGDALGAPLEFLTIHEIRRLYGAQGVTGYVELPSGRGRFTDDTQMAIFTVEALLRLTPADLHSPQPEAVLLPALHDSYLRWLRTQDSYYDERAANGWLLAQPGLFARRAPGNTCLSALRSGQAGSLARPLNHSKGCGGIMRVASLGLAFAAEPALAFRLGAESAALTHGHPSGSLSAGFLAAVLALVIQGVTLDEAIQRALALLAAYPGQAETHAAVQAALQLYANQPPSPEAIETLGGAWVGEETLAISLYCALHFSGDFRGGVLAAANHSGDCDSTAAVTGNLLGAMLGIEAIPVAWQAQVELGYILNRLSADLHTQLNRPPQAPLDADWLAKYPPLAGAG